MITAMTVNGIRASFLAGVVAVHYLLLDFKSLTSECLDQHISVVE